MKVLFAAIFSLILCLFTVRSAQATPTVADLFQSPAIQKVCVEVVTPDPHSPGYWDLEYPRFALAPDALYITKRYVPNGNGEYAIVRVNRENPTALHEIIRFKNEVNALNYHNGKLWVLFNDKLMSIDLATNKIIADITTHEGVAAAGKNFSAVNMNWVGERLVIAHGEYGVRAYDPKSNTFTYSNELNMQSGSLISKAVGVTAIDDHRVLVTVEAISLTDTPPLAFDGFKIVDLNTNIVSDYPFDLRHAGIIGVGSFTKLNGDEILLNNSGILQRASIASMEKLGMTEVSWIPLKAKISGVEATGEFMGDFLIDQNNFFGCGDFTYMSTATQRPAHIGEVVVGHL